MWKRVLRTVLLVGVVAAVVIGAVYLSRQGLSGRTVRVPAAKPQAEGAAPEGAPAPERNVVVSPLAGRWYSANGEKLAQEIQDYTDKATEALSGELPTFPLSDIQALILPHAGYEYSGPTAAYGMAAVAGRTFKRVVVMGPSHQVRISNAAGLTDATHYRTPLGEIAVDTDYVAELARHREFKTVPETDAVEHSVQIEMPLLQKTLGEFRIVPIVVGQLNAKTARIVADTLKSLIDDRTLVVASSDFTHYGPNYGYVPFRDNVAENLKTLDMGAFEEIKKKSVEGFLEYIDRTDATICGEWPIAILLAMLPEDSEAHLLHYATSGKVMGYTNSVSYLAVAFTGSWPHASSAVELAQEDKAQLLKLARGTLTYYLEHHRVPTPEQLGVEITPGMKQVMGAFVTLNEHEQLRGCIGEIVPRRPLCEAVVEQAVNAGVRDRRFRPVDAQELPEIDFEVSALFPPHPVASYNDIELGRHGIILEKNGRSAVFLPQVAPEQGWNIEQTLTHLAQKAGLPGDAWRDGAQFEVFEAIVFSEEDSQ